jgi:hypothetical protein
MDNMRGAFEVMRWYQVVEPKRHRNKEKYPGYKLLRYVQLGHNFLRN